MPKKVSRIIDPDVTFTIPGVQRSQSEKSKDKETFLANKAQQLPQKKPAGPTTKTEAVDIPGNEVVLKLGVATKRVAKL